MKLDVYLTEPVFRRFTIFDQLLRQKRWRGPAIFAAILSVCGLICFGMHQVRGAVLLGSVLLGVGLGLPCVYFATFFLSLRRQLKTLGLNPPRHIYSLEFPAGDGEIQVTNGQEKAHYPWKAIHHVYRDAEATYLYITPRRAFILPHENLEGGAEKLWALLEARLPAEKRTARL